MWLHVENRTKDCNRGREGVAASSRPYECRSESAPRATTVAPASGAGSRVVLTNSALSTQLVSPDARSPRRV
jgi:hypothetical protein